MRKRREQEQFNMSFLDVICCGFGAIVLLLMIAKTTEPIAIERAEINLEGQLKNLQQQLFSLRGETAVLNRDLDAKHEQLSEEKKRIAILKSKLEQVRADYARMAAAASTEGTRRGELYLALQTLTEEMERLLGRQHQRQNSVIGGIPVDSEYIIFIIDTSGSMFNYSWERMLEELVATLQIYPQVKGIQIMNDMGDYMFPNYRGEWIPDTPGRRDIIIKRLRSWNPFSNSSPVEGIQKAVRSFYDPGKKISLYVMGDEFTGQSIETVVNTVDRLNKERRPGERMVRIHAVGFPVQFARPPHLQTTGIRFAALMRELTYRNGGTFVGLNDYRPGK
ncbi:MAG: VWA domain-containing protein [Gammaproteobacteria bacterium]|uniref:VWA domain-containing protein n=1 Tax=Pseudomaricurvus alcaniphilus TaxID=1166482 RepID=UPI001409F368|nr:VWA domain-containing protein [Pseudomaricurvus alcaniphilus]MBR9910989.1 VWA domain-containing protein [Gammaproteobacteria bacterium]NHN37699.1 VWA domain-containing protein [Pseudomaricurvus alcaniphilus]